MLASATAKNPSGFASADPLRQGPLAADAAKRSREGRSKSVSRFSRGDCCDPVKHLLQQNLGTDCIKISSLR
jgi:hypothetical protein